MLGPDVLGTVEHMSTALVCMPVAYALAALNNKATKTWFIFRRFIF
jgi:hypothetical protein